MDLKRLSRLGTNEHQYVEQICNSRFWFWFQADHPYRPGGLPSLENVRGEKRLVWLEYSAHSRGRYDDLPAVISYKEDKIVKEWYKDGLFIAK
jgi:hypothetical protein